MSRFRMCFPEEDQSMLGFGEVRDAATAVELLRVAVTGSPAWARTERCARNNSV